MTDQIPPNMVIPDQDGDDPLPCSNCKRPLSEHSGIVCPSDQLPSKDQLAELKRYHAEIERLREDLARAESAHTAVMAENAHYKQFAADRESALRNCLLLAMRQARKDSDWKHIIRFCREGGVEPSPLRERAAQPPPVACNPDWCPTCTKTYAECRCNGVAL
jgi:uncharacterized Zn finger protein (UPF0148 family)